MRHVGTRFTCAHHPEPSPVGTLNIVRATRLLILVLVFRRLFIQTLCGVSNISYRGIGSA